MKSLLIATHNQDKFTEMEDILKGSDIEILSLEQANIHSNVIEVGSTYEENAIIKSSAFCKLTGVNVLGDDSGMEVDYLNKEPGIYSARYLGEDTPMEVKIQSILDRLKGVPKELRTARFVACLSLSRPGQKPIIVQETIEGYIGFEAIGTNGNGYDPIFYTDELGTSLGNITLQEKNAISHRGKALRKMRDIIMKLNEEDK